MARKTVMIELDKPRRMSLGLQEMADIEAHFDKGVSEVFGKRMGIGVILVTLWVCMKREEPKLTLEAVTVLVEKAVEGGKLSLDDIGAKLAELVESSGIFSGKVKSAEPTQD